MNDAKDLKDCASDRQFSNVTCIVDLVRSALYELKDPKSWTKEFADKGNPAYYRKLAKEIRIELPRRAGTSTAALTLYDMYPDSPLVYRNYAELGYQLNQRRWENFAGNRDVFVLPELPTSPAWKSLGPILDGRPRSDLMIFDGVSRMNEQSLDMIKTMFDPYVKLFVLLG